MRRSTLPALLAIVAACGLIAAGCGDDEESSSADTTSESTALTLDTTASDDTESSTAEDSGDGEVDADGVYEACADAVSGTPAEDTALAGCEQARDAFESCATQAESLDGSAREDALKICSEAADQVISAAESTSGG